MTNMEIDDDDKNKNDTKNNNNESDDDYSVNEGEQIRVSLLLAPTITDESIRVPSDPIAVPSDVRRRGLSAVVNHLLDRKVPREKRGDDESSEEESDDEEEKLPAIPFDFLVNNRLLRTGVEAAARRDGLSLEQAIEITYFPARKAPESSEESESLPDWINAMSYEKHNEDENGMLFTGVADGSLSAFQCVKDGIRSIDTVAAHTGPIKCLSSMKMSSEKYVIATGSMDQTLVTHTIRSTDDDEKDARRKLELHAVYGGGHFNSIGSVTMTNNSNGEAIMASADWDGGLCFWKVPSLASAGGSNDDTNESSAASSRKKHKSKKKRRTEEEPVEEDLNSPSIIEVQPLSTIRAHASNISGLSFGYNSNANTILSSSWDHSVKVWDVEKSDCILTLNGSKVVTCLGRCHNSDVMATGHPDCTVRLWDMRTGTGGGKQGSSQVSDSILKPSHKSWVSAVQWSPKDPYVLASTSHDGTVKMWDIRSSLPLHTIRAQPKGQKGLCLAYAGGVIYSGGSDCIVRKFVC